LLLVFMCFENEGLMWLPLKMVIPFAPGTSN